MSAFVTPTEHFFLYGAQVDSCQMLFGPVWWGEERGPVKEVTEKEIILQSFEAIAGNTPSASGCTHPWAMELEDLSMTSSACADLVSS